MAMMGLLLTGCLAQSSIQADYMEAQDDCRSQAEDAVSKMPDDDALSAKQRNAALVDRFADCMNRNGWHVTRPAPAASNASAVPPQVPAAVAIQRAPQVIANPQAAAAAQQPVYVPPPSTAGPSTQPVQAMPQPGTYSYQPAAGADGADYSTVGRHF